MAALRSLSWVIGYSSGRAHAPRQVIRMTRSRKAHASPWDPCPRRCAGVGGLQLGSGQACLPLPTSVASPAADRAACARRAGKRAPSRPSREGIGCSPAGRRPAVPRRASNEVLLAGILLARIERWLEQEGVFHVAGFGDVELAGELDWEPGVGPVYLRRLDDGQVWRVNITMTARRPSGGLVRPSPGWHKGGLRPTCSAGHCWYHPAPALRDYMSTERARPA